jgi:hypothetical protein
MGGRRMTDTAADGVVTGPRHQDPNEARNRR